MFNYFSLHLVFYIVMELAHDQSMSPPSPTQEIPNYNTQQISVDENTNKCNDIEALVENEKLMTKTMTKIRL